MSTTTLSITKVGTVVVPVADQERAIAFYVDTLGFEKRADAPFGPDGGYRWIEVAPTADADTTIALPPPPPGRSAGGAQTGITLHTTDIEADRAALAARGVDVDAEVSRMGGPVPPLCWFRDPEANVLMLVEVA